MNKWKARQRIPNEVLLRLLRIFQGTLVNHLLKSRMCSLSCVLHLIDTASHRKRRHDPVAPTFLLRFEIADTFPGSDPVASRPDLPPGMTGCKITQAPEFAPANETHPRKIECADVIAIFEN
jgi:hypothetical protein